MEENIYEQTTLEGFEAEPASSSETPETPETIEAIVPVKRTRKPKEAVRSLEDLENVSPTKMSTKEAAAVITNLRDGLKLQKNIAAEARETASKSFEQYRIANENYQGLLQEYNARMRQIEDMARVFNLSIKMMTSGGAR